MFFPKGKQGKFLLEVSRNCGLPWALLASRLGISKRTLFDWRREKYSLSLGSFEKMCKLANLDFLADVEIREAFWPVKKAAHLGGVAMYRKYGTIGDPLIRRKHWLEWWEKKGKYNPKRYFVAKSITKPVKSKELAEFVGILIGDGGVTKRQVIITLNSVVDKEYVDFVEKLIITLFDLRPKIRSRKNELSTRIEVSRTNLVAFCQGLGLKVGNKIKQNLDIPDWIKADEEFEKACVRGLMDTDGCLFMEKHKIKGKIYAYPRLSLVSMIPALRSSVYSFFEELGFSPRIRGERSVQLENCLDIKCYFDKIGTSHPKNKKKFLECLERCREWSSGQS